MDDGRFSATRGLQMGKMRGWKPLGSRTGRSMNDLAEPTPSRALLNRILRIVVGLAAVLGALVVFKRLLFASFEALVHLTPEASVIAGRAGSLLVIAGAYFLFVRYYEKRRPTELAFRPMAIALGAFSGAALIGLTIIALALAGSYRVESVRGFGLALPVICTILTAALLEELIFRGVLFRIVEEQVGTVIAIALVSLLFGVLHLFNPGTTLMTALSVSLLGAFWCGVFAVSRNLWVAAANHAAWNLTIFFSGIPLSGEADWRAQAPVVAQASGPAWLTGADFGPEDSVITVFVLAIVVGVLLYVLSPRPFRAPSSNEMVP
jgi:membrane protease YdiL (CAAX protease family)